MRWTQSGLSQPFIEDRHEEWLHDAEAETHALGLSKGDCRMCLQEFRLCVNLYEDVLSRWKGITGFEIAAAQAEISND